MLQDIIKLYHPTLETLEKIRDAIKITILSKTGDL